MPSASLSKSIMLKPSVNTTSLHGFLPLRNYTFAVTYHLIVSGLPLQSSKTAAPVTVHMPDIGEYSLANFTEQRLNQWRTVTFQTKGGHLELAFADGVTLYEK